MSTSPSTSSSRPSNTYQSYLKAPLPTSEHPASGSSSSSSLTLTLLLAAKNKALVQKRDLPSQVISVPNLHSIIYQEVFARPEVVSAMSSPASGRAEAILAGIEASGTVWEQHGGDLRDEDANVDAVKNYVAAAVVAALNGSGLVRRHVDFWSQSSQPKRDLVVGCRGRPEVRGKGKNKAEGEEDEIFFHLEMNPFRVLGRRISAAVERNVKLSYDLAEPDNGVDILNKIACYLQTDNAELGGIASYKGYRFVARTAGGRLAVSEEVPYRCSNPSIREIIASFVLRGSLGGQPFTFPGETALSSLVEEEEDGKEAKSREGKEVSKKQSKSRGLGGEVSGSNDKSARERYRSCQTLMITHPLMDSVGSYSRCLTYSQPFSTLPLPPSPPSPTSSLDECALAVDLGSILHHHEHVSIFGPTADVIIKIVEESEVAMERVRGEVLIYEKLSALQGIIIPELYGVFEDGRGKVLILAMENVGESLSNWLGEEEWVNIDLSIRTEILILAQILVDDGVEHLDLEPRNVCRRQDGSYRIIDFGQCRWAVEDKKDALNRIRESMCL